MNAKALFDIKWTIENPKANCLIIHGYGEHIQRYQHVAAALNNIGFGVYGFDLRGHGKSEGSSGYINGFDDYISDTMTTITSLKEQGIEIDYILAHSMGGLVLASLLIADKIKPKAVVFSSPMLMPDDGVPKILIALSSVLSKLLPTLRTITIDVHKIATDAETVKKYQTDPLILHQGIPVRTGKSFLDQMEWVRSEVSKISLPFLVITGTADEIVNPAGSKYLYDNASSVDKQYVAYDGMYHELMHETIRDEVLKNLTDWFEKQMN